MNDGIYRNQDKNVLIIRNCQNYAENLEFLTATYHINLKFDDSFQRFVKAMDTQIRATWPFNHVNIKLHYSLLTVESKSLIHYSWNEAQQLPNEDWILIFPNNLPLQSIDDYPIIQCWYNYLHPIHKLF